MVLSCAGSSWGEMSLAPQQEDMRCMRGWPVCSAAGCWAAWRLSSARPDGSHQRSRCLHCHLAVITAESACTHFWTLFSTPSCLQPLQQGIGSHLRVLPRGCTGECGRRAVQHCSVRCQEGLPASDAQCCNRHTESRHPEGTICAGSGSMPALHIRMSHVSSQKLLANRSAGEGRQLPPVRRQRRWPSWQ